MSHGGHSWLIELYEKSHTFDYIYIYIYIYIHTPLKIKPNSVRISEYIIIIFSINLVSQVTWDPVGQIYCMVVTCLDVYIYIRLKIKPNSVRIRFLSCQICVLPSTGFELTPLIHCSTICLDLRPAPLEHSATSAILYIFIYIYTNSILVLQYINGAVQIPSWEEQKFVSSKI